MRRAAASALVILCSLSCSQHGGPSGTAVYTDQSHAFRLRYPKKWQRVPMEGTAVVLFSGGGSNRQMTVFCEPGGEEQIGEEIRQLGRSLPAHKVLDAGWTTVHGRRAYFQEAQWNSPLGDNRAFRLFVPAGDRFFVVCASTPAKEFERFAPLLRSCVLSFEVTEKCASSHTGSDDSLDGRHAVK
ncbi:MAG: hypothetical protein GXP25_24370 [Planctomycetes bacterium]|nr:hypothetical protein [Planctomycetota bacterium]